MNKLETILQYLKSHGLTASEFERESGLGNGSLAKTKAAERDISGKLLLKIKEKNPKVYGAIFGESLGDTASNHVPDKYIGQLEKNIEVLEKQVTLLEGQVSSLQGQIRNNSLLAASLATTNQGVLIEILCHLKKLKIGEVEQRLGKENFDNLERLRKVVGN